MKRKSLQACPRDALLHLEGFLDAYEVCVLQACSKVLRATRFTKAYIAQKSQLSRVATHVTEVRLAKNNWMLTCEDFPKHLKSVTHFNCGSMVVGEWVYENNTFHSHHEDSQQPFFPASLTNLHFSKDFNMLFPRRIFDNLSRLTSLHWPDAYSWIMPMLPHSLHKLYLPRNYDDQSTLSSYSKYAKWPPMLNHLRIGLTAFSKEKSVNEFRNMQHLQSLELFCCRKWEKEKEHHCDNRFQHLEIPKSVQTIRAFGFLGFEDLFIRNS